MKIKMTRRVIAGILAFVLVSSSLFVMPAVTTSAATWEEINQSGIFMKQKSGSNNCTLIAATMLMRRAALLKGDANWASITEDVMTSAAWITGSGLKWDINYGEISVKHADFSGNPADLVALLAVHPEGVVLYKQKSDQTHAILVTDYTGGVFYCADPSPGAPEGRIAIDSATIAVEEANYIWIVTSPDLYLTDAQGNVISHETIDPSTLPTASPSPSPTATAKPKATATAKPKATASAKPKATATTKPKATENPKVTTKPKATAEPEETVKAPKKVASLIVKNNKKKTLTTSWSKVSGASGYQLLYGTDKTFAGCASISQSKKKCRLTKLTKGEVYYVKVRAYKMNGTQRVYGKCSAVKKVKVKK